jgi:hypothetical protein
MFPITISPPDMEPPCVVFASAVQPARAATELITAMDKSERDESMDSPFKKSVGLRRNHAPGPEQEEED